jgi:hypothetical protein
MAAKNIGGSFAPPLDSDQIAAYEVLAEECSDRKCKGYMLDLLKMVKLFRETPASTLPGPKHATGLVQITPLEEAEIERIWDVVPWFEECRLIGAAFDVLTGPTRNAAYHLLWFAKELSKDREPLTKDKL